MRDYSNLNYDDLDPQEKAFIDNYRQLDPEGKRDVFNMLRYLAQVDLEEDTEDIPPADYDDRLEFTLTERAYQLFKNDYTSLFALGDMFMAHDFGSVNDLDDLDSMDEVDLARVQAFAKCFDLPKYHETAFGIYPLEAGVVIYIIMHEEYNKLVGHGTLIVATHLDIDLFAEDPLQTIIDNITHARRTAD